MPVPPSQEPVALVLAGGCARGAYEFGALSVLLPILEQRGQRPRIILGTSVGALNATYLAAKAHLPAGEAVADGERIWRSLGWSEVIGHLISLSSAGRALSYAGQAVEWPGARVRSLLDPAPLIETIKLNVDFDRLRANVDGGPLLAAAVVATSALSHQSVVFHEGGGSPAFDARRLIHYVGTHLTVEHVRASTAMPAVFPAVHVEDPEAGGWYYDGGTRLNAPLKPALEFGAKRMVVIGLSSLSPGSRGIAGDARPDLFGGIGLLLRGLIGDQLVQDVHTLARVNEDIEAGRRGDRRPIPYIVVAPEQPDTVEQLALGVFRERYKSFLRGLARSVDIEILGKLAGAGAEEANATLLSLLLFDPEFIDALIELGAKDAARWVEETHDDGLWQLRALPGSG
jgi:NTE family protein